MIKPGESPVCHANAPECVLPSNPPKEEVTLESGLDIVKSVTVSDLTGRAILSLPGKDATLLSVPVAALPDGVYLFDITTTKGNAKKKIVV